MEDVNTQILWDVLNSANAYSAPTWITGVAAIVLVLCASKLVKTNSKPLWLLTVFCLILIILSQTANWLHQNYQPPMSAQNAFKRLRDNERVNWLVRLVPYNKEKQPELSVQSIKKLGPPSDEFVFVGDYEELKNCTVKEAILRTGLSIGTNNALTAVFFPLGNNQLYPANCRGVLQVTRELDSRHKSDVEYKSISYEQLTADALKDLSDTGIDSYRWEAYSPFFEEYNLAVAKARENNSSAFKVMGKFGKDWMPTGYSKRIDGISASAAPNFKLYTKNTAIELPRFGVRAFLIENLEIASLDEVVLIKFSNLDVDKLPDLSGRTGGAPPLAIR